MATVREQRQRLRFAAYLMAAICLLAVLYLLAPITASTSQKQQELLNKQSELRGAEQQTKPLQQLPQLVARSRTDIAGFYADRLPAYPSTVYASVYDIARKNNVNVTEVKYEVFSTNVESLQVLQVSAKVGGAYPNIVRFINSVERNKLFYLIDGLQLSESGATSGGIQLNVQMETYLRPRTAKDKPAAVPAKVSDDEEGEE